MLKRVLMNSESGSIGKQVNVAYWKYRTGISQKWLGLLFSSIYKPVFD
jgi:hypothetical protein